jgi:hypothetical protein
MRSVDFSDSRIGWSYLVRLELRILRERKARCAAHVVLKPDPLAANLHTDPSPAAAEARRFIFKENLDALCLHDRSPLNDQV